MQTIRVDDAGAGSCPGSGTCGAHACTRRGRGLEYRDFITVGLLYRRLMPNPGGTGERNIMPDNWIYVQEPGVNVGRLQIFNNWSPHMVRDTDTVWIGMEYFCREGDELWRMSDADLVALGVREMERLRLASAADHLDGVVVRMPKAYPGYYGSYAHFDEVREYLDRIPNLFLVGRNGMHRYNNQDHSMLSAKLAVEAIVSGSSDKSPIWELTSTMNTMKRIPARARAPWQLPEATKRVQCSEPCEGGAKKYM